MWPASILLLLALLGGGVGCAPGAVNVSIGNRGVIENGSANQVGTDNTQAAPSRNARPVGGAARAPVTPTIKESVSGPVKEWETAKQLADVQTSLQELEKTLTQVREQTQGLKQPEIEDTNRQLRSSADRKSSPEPKSGNAHAPDELDWNYSVQYFVDLNGNLANAYVVIWTNHSTTLEFTLSRYFVNLPLDKQLRVLDQRKHLSSDKEAVAEVLAAIRSDLLERRLAMRGF